MGISVTGVVSRTLNLLKRGVSSRLTGAMIYAKEEAKKTYQEKTAPPPTCGSCRFVWGQRHPVGITLTMCLHPLREDRVLAVNHQIPPMTEECALRKHRAKGTLVGELTHLLSLRGLPSFDDDRLYHKIRRVRELVNLVVFGENGDTACKEGEGSSNKDAQPDDGTQPAHQNPQENTFTSVDIAPSVDIVDRYGFFFDKSAIPAFEHQATTAESVRTEIRNSEPPSPPLDELKIRYPFFFDKKNRV